jgi:O-glycosyl hydrolase
MCSAYRNTDGKWVAVVINYSNQMQDFNLHLSTQQSTQWQMYRTSDVSGETLKPVGKTTGKQSLPPRSITTFVAE